MKAFLMHRDRDFDPEAKLPANADALVQDLELSTLFDAMALGDEFLFEVARRAVLLRLDEPEAITYRQQVLGDCLARPDVVREIYRITVAATEAEKKDYMGGFMSRSPDLILYRSVRVLEVFVGALRQLRQIADEHAEEFRSEGFARFFRMIEEELDDAYFGVVEGHLRELKFKGGVVISARLGKGNKGTGYVLRRPLPESRGWMQRIFGKGEPAYGFELADRDEPGIQALAELRGRGIHLVANALAQSVDHILSFFTLLRAELGFYIGCLNLHARLEGEGEPTCMPVAVPAGRAALSARGLYDVCLTLRTEGRVVGNDLAADGKRLVLITGANQGGKSTFLRSVGLAQVMMQCGMYVAAERFAADVCAGVFTHYKREEDAAMKSGKLEEELVRMSEIVDQIRPRCLLLCNESLASTNEREGSEVARQIVRALLEAHVKVFFVTHMYDLAGGFHRQGMDDALFLRAERERTFRLVEGEPLSTSFGADLYREVFAATAASTD